MNAMKTEVADFIAKVEERRREANQRAALQLICNVDMDSALSGGAQDRCPAIERVDRAIRAERLKGLSRHWSYDLNRHIALKQASERLKSAEKQSAAIKVAALGKTRELLE